MRTSASRPPPRGAGGGAPLSFASPRDRPQRTTDYQSLKPALIHHALKTKTKTKTKSAVLFSVLQLHIRVQRISPSGHPVFPDWREAVLQFAHRAKAVKRAALTPASEFGCVGVSLWCVAMEISVKMSKSGL